MSENSTDMRFTPRAGTRATRRESERGTRDCGYPVCLRTLLVADSRHVDMNSSARAPAMHLTKEKNTRGGPWPT
ncbi:hypothetical protein UPYG_G00036130 [Umbra pygmaea]|uniref:Uncharacterized protein n=1 Tax=Umbra pygmaea TaxID=75934 RepID=A0ABD0Y2H8_UMBPY